MADIFQQVQKLLEVVFKTKSLFIHVLDLLILNYGSVSTWFILQWKWLPFRIDYQVLITVGQITSQGETGFNSAPTTEISNLLFIENMKVTAILFLPKKQFRDIVYPKQLQ